MVADSTEEYASIEEIYQKFSPIFQYENIDKLSEDDFRDFFQSSNVSKFFATRRSYEVMHAGQIRKENFPELIDFFILSVQGRDHISYAKE